MKDDSIHTLSSETGKSETPADLLSSKEELSNEGMSPRLKPSTSDISDFETQPTVNLKPDVREFPRHTSKDTLSILKAKRIIRHNKPNEGPDMKKHKSD